MNKLRLTILLGGSLACVGSLFSIDSYASTSFGSPNTVDNTIKDNTRKKESWREKLASEHNLTLGLDYQVLGLSASSPTAGGDDNSAAGVVRFYGSWNLTGLESGNVGGLVWKVEHRHAYTDTAPKAYSFIEPGLGYIGMIGPAYSDQGGRLTNLYWKQQFNQGKTALMAGYLDTSDYVDTYALASPWTGFTNLAFSTGAGAIGLPDDGVLGLAVGHMLDDNFYIIAGAADAKGRSDKPSDGFETLFNDHKLFTTFELGWTASQEHIYTDNVHVTLWHMDGGTQHNLTQPSESGQGINFSASFFVTPQLMPFVRGGISQGDVALYDNSLTMGLGYFGLGGEKNNLGFAINFSEVNENLGKAYGVTDDKQFTSEVYYNMSLGEFVQLTPNIQYIDNPAISTEDDTWVIGLRARVSF
ncbi:carbohydrate porin [Shewanella pealeana]|uniref:Carbohydrate-selective porin OprB n=1 Tax=Shewanella pealeana (strain ATCC 700345 / ANG-SQ1) TaxID=398579 RepID=A8H6Z2_SHEPA|nr:carbohydrate porin [Shewanella pealeana]ABV88329.1 Carbohydrate-selective porin OprB [Shewanella pealeana ATCC 700345]